MVPSITPLAEVFGGSRHLKQQQWGSRYVRGLMMEGARQSADAMALYVPEGDEQAPAAVCQRQPVGVLDVRRWLVEQALAAFPEDRYLIFDETGFPKQGQHTVGVARQYCGTLGKIGNCQVAVSLHLATQQAAVPVDWDLYLPETWIADPERLRKAQVPEGTQFRTKGEIALNELNRVRSWGIGTYTVLANAGYCNGAEFRAGLTALGHYYVLGVQGSTGVWPADVPGAPKARRSRTERPRVCWDYGDARPTSMEALARSVPPRLGRWFNGTTVRARRHRDYFHGKWLEPEEWLLIEWPEDKAEPSHYWLSPCRQTLPCRPSSAPPSFAGASNSTTGSSKANLARTTSRGAAGQAGSVMSRSFRWPTTFSSVSSFRVNKR